MISHQITGVDIKIGSQEKNPNQNYSFYSDLGKDKSIIEQILPAAQKDHLKY